MSATQFELWDAERRAAKAEEKARKAETLLRFEAGLEEAARSETPVQAKQETTFKPITTRQRRQSAHRGAESSLRRSGWLAGPKVIALKPAHNGGKRSKKWIGGAIKRPGALTAKLIAWKLLKPGRKITASVLNKALKRAKRKKDQKTIKQINLVKMLQKYRRKRKDKK